MRTLIVTIFLIIGFSMPEYGHAQEGGVSKRRVEKSVKTKGGYNSFLLESIHSSDKIYSDYESKVQQVWNGESKENLEGSSKKPLRDLAEVQQSIKEIPVYKGGDDYQKAVSNYLNAVEKKINLLETLGVLGANPDTEAREYNNISRAFTDISNEAIDIRNAVRRVKRNFEKQ